MFVLGVTPRVPLPVAVGFVAGMGIEQFGVAWDTSMQQHVPPDRLARVYSYDALGSFIAIPLGQIAAGPLFEQFGRTETLVGAAVLMVAVSVAAVAVPSVRRLENTAAPARAG